MALPAYILPLMGSELDADARAFLSAANITNQTQRLAINTLVVSLKNEGLWSLFTAIYPMVGGTAATHIYNLKNPSQYNLTFSGTWTHSSTGALPNGVNAYASTGINTSTVLTQNNNHIAYYSRSNTAAGTIAKISMGAYDNVTSPNPILALTAKNALGNAGVFNTSQSSGQFASVANTDSRGFYIGNKTSASIGSLTIDKDGSQIAANTVAVTTNAYPNVNLFLGASSRISGVVFSYDDRECALASVGLAFTSSAQRTTYRNIVQTYQTSLSRNV